jgi:hypothetical protein
LNFQFKKTNRIIGKSNLEIAAATSKRLTLNAAGTNALACDFEGLPRVGGYVMVSQARRIRAAHPQSLSLP